MLICIFAGEDPGTMTELQAPEMGIGEEQLAGSAPMVRALVVQRLEMMWRTCEPFITSELGKPDPRFIEAGIRITDRLTKLYRLDNPVHGGQEEQTSRIPVQELVMAQVAELEARMTGAAADPGSS